METKVTTTYPRSGDTYHRTVYAGFAEAYDEIEHAAAESRGLVAMEITEENRRALAINAPIECRGEFRHF